ncbi:MAG: creatininase family protein [Alphaproteobacteria bacterium]|nr:creatininase family protein [Alphaproteobacteria bacterium]MBU0795925.1 creatininase family protein [Alphaproteobacteria bacterium]MBU0886962.1 creatininase family protein [Alphaproteobacteria bacterium]MBU1813182.1 creatininase family protein [Alphaproteobacteria bacterium]
MQPDSQPLLPSRYWRDLTTVEIAALDRDRTILILPMAAIEQHGPHLPLCVDADLNAGIVERALGRLQASLPILVLPLIEIGKSNEHQGFPGTLTVSAETLIRQCTEIAESVARAGFRKLVLFNSHGGQPQIMDIIAVDLRVRLEMLVVAANWYDFGLPAEIPPELRAEMPEGFFPADELAHGIHGGAVETSMMLHLEPHKVRLDRLGNFTSRMSELAQTHPLVAQTGFAWMTQDLHYAGALGDATLADARKGRMIVEHAAEKLAGLLMEIDTLPDDLLKPGAL